MGSGGGAWPILLAVSDRSNPTAGRDAAGPNAAGLRGPNAAAVVVSAATQVLAHAPGLARHGSKPSRELKKDATVEASFLDSLRTFDEAVAYPAHQAYIGAVHPRALPPRPWSGPDAAAPAGASGESAASRFGPVGEIVPEWEFLGLLASVDEFELLTLSPEAAERAASALADHPLAKVLGIDRIEKAIGDAASVAQQPGALPLHTRDGEQIGRASCRERV